MITNVAGGKTICLQKTEFPDTGKSELLYSLQMDKEIRKAS